MKYFFNSDKFRSHITMLSLIEIFASIGILISASFILVKRSNITSESLYFYYNSNVYLEFFSFMYLLYTLLYFFMQENRNFFDFYKISKFPFSLLLTLITVVFLY